MFMTMQLMFTLPRNVKQLLCEHTNTDQCLLRCPWTSVWALNSRMWSYFSFCRCFTRIPGVGSSKSLNGNEARGRGWSLVGTLLAVLYAPSLSSGDHRLARVKSDAQSKGGELGHGIAWGMDEFAQLDALVYATSTVLLPSFYLFLLYLPECGLLLFTHRYFVEVCRDTGPSKLFACRDCIDCICHFCWCCVFFE